MRVDSAVAEGTTGDWVRSRVAGLLGRLAYGLVYLMVAALLVGLPVATLFLLGRWLWG